MPRLSVRRLVLSGLTAGSAAVGFLAVQQIVSAQDRVAFTAAAHYSVYAPSGEVAFTEEQVLATRRDGYYVRVRSIPRRGSRGPTIQKAIKLSRKPQSCTADGPAVRGSVLGYQVVRRVRDLPSGPEMLVRREEWLAPALDCFPLRIATSRGPTEAEMYISSLTEVLQVSLGEPAPSLFERPAAFR